MNSVVKKAPDAHACNSAYAVPTDENAPDPFVTVDERKEIFTLLKAIQTHTHTHKSMKRGYHKNDLPKWKIEIYPRNARAARMMEEGEWQSQRCLHAGVFRGCVV